MEPRNRCQGINSASLCSMAGRYDNPIPTRCLAPIDFFFSVWQPSSYSVPCPHRLFKNSSTGFFYQGTNSDRDSIMSCAVKSSCKTGYISLSLEINHIDFHIYLLKKWFSRFKSEIISFWIWTPWLIPQRKHRKNVVKLFLDRHRLQ